MDQLIIWSMNKWMGHWMNESVNKWINAWKNQWMNGSMNKYIFERSVNEWRKWIHWWRKQTYKWIFVNFHCYLKIKTVAVTLKKEGNLEKMSDITKTDLCLIHYDKFDILPYFMLLAIERYFAFLQHPKTYKHWANERYSAFLQHPKTY